jgi:hypothetical protein
MALSLSGRVTAVCTLLTAVLAGQAYGQAFYATNGLEYPIIGTLSGDQAHPQIALTATNGYIVWEDNRTDAYGLGISARRLDGSFSGVFSTFRVNVTGTNNQQNPQVALLKKGGAAFIWQGGAKSHQQIFARFLSPSNTWSTGEIRVNTATNQPKMNPVIATLADGNLIVVWSSYNQRSTNSLQDIYGQRLSPAGAKLGTEFFINQTSAYNQRTPVVASLSDGRFIVVWVSEQQRFQDSVDIYGRLFTTAGAAAGNEFLINTGTNICANPTVAASLAYGGFMVAWSEHGRTFPSTGWDIKARSFSNDLTGGDAHTVNSHITGDQYGPRLANLGPDYFAVWTSMNQDGSREGVFGQFMRSDGTPFGDELLVNTTTASMQIHPAVASDSYGRFLVAWSSFASLANGMDLYAQRYSTSVEPLGTPDPPTVTALSSNALSLTWATTAGYNLSGYEIYADGATSPSPTVSVTNTFWTMTNLAPASVHTFRLAYVLKDGRRSPLSASVVGRTYSASPTWGGIPQEWMIQYFGSDILSWPSPNADSDGDGVSNLNEFLAGTDPTDPNSVLTVRLETSHEGLFLNWNTEPGLLYQVQSSVNLVSWINVGGTRFSAGRVDSMYVGGSNSGYFRVVRVR